MNWTSPVCRLMTTSIAIKNLLPVTEGHRILLKIMRKDCKSQKGQGHQKKTYGSNSLSSKTLTESEPTTVEPAWNDLGLYISDSCVAWSTL